MIYTNDETDKTVRQKNFILTVYIIPISMILGLCIVFYLAYNANFILKKDSYYGCFFTIPFGLLLYINQKNNWLKMPDGSYYNVKNIEPTNKTTLNEPSEYETEYYFSKKEKTNKTLIGFALILFSLWMCFKGLKTIMLAIGTIAVGAFISYGGIKGLLDKGAQLKLAKKGLWTKKLGFVDWNDIAKAQVIEDKSGRTPKTYLEIFLKGTVFALANQPDQRLFLTDIDGTEYVDLMVDNLMSKRNEITS